MAYSYNTISAYNTSSAYDLSAFEAQEKPVQRKQELKVVRSPKQFLASAFTLKNVCLFMMTVTVITLMVYNYASLNEVTGEINDLTSQLTALESNYVKLESEASAQMNPRIVAEHAENELGLKKADKYQTEYIYLYHDDKIEIAGQAKEAGLGESIKVALNSAIQTIKEYIAGI
ncbi:hypothetical protein LJC63_08440 [Ruminococcaceae bacterium OttesenSCG-928-L11]|nr:hypothetical protein [Ruminococcaceae bacterium OttesenSCG-928-L11]